MVTQKDIFLGVKGRTIIIQAVSVLIDIAMLEKVNDESLNI